MSKLTDEAYFSAAKCWNAGYSAREIADAIKKKFGVSVTRQAIAYIAANDRANFKPRSRDEINILISKGMQNPKQKEQSIYDGW